MKMIEEQCKQAYDSSPDYARLSTTQKNTALKLMAETLLINKSTIIKENQKDLQNGKKAGLSSSLLDRLTLNETRIKGIVDSISQIAGLKDPVGEVIKDWTVPNGIHIKKVRVPLGVIGMIYEARPNVTADAIALAIKTGNAIVLRGSSSAYNSNKAISELMKSILLDQEINSEGIQLLEDTSRDGVQTFITQRDYLSLVIPRGSGRLIQTVVQNATVPAIETGEGNCHILVDESADIEQALSIIQNAKVQRPSVCNSCEKVLVHKSIASEFIPKLVKLLESHNVECRGCEKTKAISSSCSLASEKDWETEYLDLVIGIKVVSSVKEGIKHIRKYTTHHSEAILSKNQENITEFQQEIDASAVLVNTSTRFVDGGEFGFGAELGISTQKLHARGPMGITELCSTKYLLEGNGQIRI